MMTIHHEFNKGKKVIVKMRDGSTIIDKYIENRSRGIVLQNVGFVSYADITNVGIFKGDRD